MSEPYRALFLAALALWLAALALLSLALRRAPGRERAWALMERFAPRTDLAGTWLGALAALALLLGRAGFSAAWAAALLLTCLMLTAGLYDRAVLLPSLAAAWKRLHLGGDPERWEGEWCFLWRMAAWTRAATVLAGAAALGCGALA